MEKVYYTISEVCNILKLKSHTIRYWETEIPQLKKNTKKGYSRRYTKKDIEFLEYIKELIVKRKFSLEGAAKEIKNRNKDIEFTLPGEIENTIIIDPIEPINPKIDIEHLKKELKEIKELILKR